MKWQWLRRVALVGVNFLYLTPALFGWTLLTGDLSASTFLGVPLVDPLAGLQNVLATKNLYPKMLLAAAIVLVFYMIVGGRSFCSWVCPYHLLAEMGQGVGKFLENRFGIQPRRFSLKIKYGVLALVLILSMFVSVSVFEIVSPVGMASRNLIYGAEAGLVLVFLLLLIEMFFAQRVWCRSLCPLGAFYSMAGRYGLFRVRVKNNPCPSNCHVCRDACFVSEILDPAAVDREEWIHSGECTNCGACVDRCIKGTLCFGLRWNPWQRARRA